MPGDRLGEDAWYAGHLPQCTYLPGYDPPRDPADLGSNNKSVPGQESVDPDKCANGSDLSFCQMQRSRP